MKEILKKYVGHVGAGSGGIHAHGDGLETAGEG